MKRRDLIAASAVVAGGWFPGPARSAVPCPPSPVTVAGGGSATTACATSGTTYSTIFSLTENPISEGAKWNNGKAVGLDWNDVKTVPGKAYASMLSGLSGSRYNDSIAHLSTSFATYTPNQYAQGSVFRVAGNFPSGSGHEVELLLRFKITPHNARGYEVLWGFQGYIAIVRWNGPLGNYSALYDSGLPGIGPAVEGDVLRAEMIGSLIKVYKNGALVATATDTTWTDGQPGMGFWPVDGATPQNFGWKSYTGGNL
jgi:hypothetical protein